VSRPDFELTARLRARTLVSHEPPHATLEGEGEIELSREEVRSRASGPLQPSGRYDDLALEKHVTGTIRGSRRASARAQRDA
jgi:hypothetical protein